ncbi:hypothetical protein GXW82_32570 [Streptacidiphilus sp. 4-A2]|nr:hypothetical protein [Streptacidiphilus sp. 4-A2]
MHAGDGDLPGYGAADFLPADRGIGFLAATVRHMLAELEMPRVNLIGSCFGGAIALRFAPLSRTCGEAGWWG